ncbi:hypothetical protein BU16DRAFT_494294 [Lophium mytilinum]|uniref:Mitochondrial import inner membrane translocase subunit n=1 Tax=Lophium mytilinum TaxID=390894 RepID=A0A6A6QEA6_9PEZI|nr:hypothetical protein BU16DRAFT_494294 [Lophium mytilinum]
MDSLGGGPGFNEQDLAKLSERDKQELTQFVQNESQKARIQSAIHNLTDTCFRKCVTSKIASRELDKYEQPCMQNCVDRWMDANNVIMKELQALQRN